MRPGSAAYQGAERIGWTGAQFRRDIAGHVAGAATGPASWQGTVAGASAGRAR